MINYMYANHIFRLAIFISLCTKTNNHQGKLNYVINTAAKKIIKNAPLLWILAVAADESPTKDESPSGKQFCN